MEHVARYPFSARFAETVSSVERALSLPYWHWTHDQGKEGSCVGHGGAMERAICNTIQNKKLGLTYPGRRYNPIQIWNEAKRIDEWPDTNPGDDEGTSVRAAYDVLRTLGPARVTSMKLENNVPVPYGEKPPDPAEGVAVTRWARNVDEVRTAISKGLPVTLGVNWYSKFDNPIVPEGRTWYWIGVNSKSQPASLGYVRGGHCVTIYGASDRLQAVRIKNSWGRDYPLILCPYTVLQRLINEQGEAALVTDR